MNQSKLINSISHKYKKKFSIRDQINNKEKECIAKHKKKIIFMIILAVVFVLLSIPIYFKLNKKLLIDDNTNICKLNSNKYSKEIINLYNRDGELDKFLKEMNRVQTLVGTYIISNTTLNEELFNQLIKTLNKEINEEKWVTLDSEKSKYYTGVYSVDKSGNIKFKFSSKNIEPDWINNQKIVRYVILN